MKWDTDSLFSSSDGVHLWPLATHKATWGRYYNTSPDTNTKKQNPLTLQSILQWRSLLSVFTSTPAMWPYPQKGIQSVEASLAAATHLILPWPTGPLKNINPDFPGTKKSCSQVLKTLLKFKGVTTSWLCPKDHLQSRQTDNTWPDRWTQDRQRQRVDSKMPKRSICPINSSRVKWCNMSSQNYILAGSVCSNT